MVVGKAYLNFHSNFGVSNLNSLGIVCVYLSWHFFFHILGTFTMKLYKNMIFCFVKAHFRFSQLR
jgi:hypothetical protein